MKTGKTHRRIEQERGKERQREKGLEEREKKSNIGGERKWHKFI